MSITSISFAYVQYSSTAAMAQPRVPAPVAAPVAQPEPSRDCRHRECDSPRKSPLFRALVDALAQMARPTQTSAAAGATAAPAAPATTAGAAANSGAVSAAGDAASTTATPTAPAAEAAAEAGGETVDLEEALMNFARALMQALRGDGHRSRRDDEEERGQHHHHHHRGYQRWADPAEGVERLSHRVGASAAAAVAPANAAATATAAKANNVIVQDDVSLEPTNAVTTGATAGTEAAAGNAGNTSVQLTININVSAANSQVGRTQERLLNAFGSLQQALGRTVDENSGSLRAQLTAFLQALAQRMRGDDGAVSDTAAPGTLLNTTA